MTLPSAPAYSPIRERLRMEMKKRGLTSAELARRADVKISFLYDIMSGKSANPSTITLAKVAEALSVDLSYLIGASDSAQRPAGDTAQDYVAIPRISVQASAGGGAAVFEERETESYHFRKSWVREHLRCKPQDLRILNIRGDSMHPTLQHDDMILVDTSKKYPTPPGIFILYDGFGLVAKRLEFAEPQGKTRLRILSDNAQYSPYERGLDEVIVVGRVVWFAREI